MQLQTDANRKICFEHKILLCFTFSCSLYTGKRYKDVPELGLQTLTWGEENYKNQLIVIIFSYLFHTFKCTGCFIKARRVLLLYSNKFITSFAIKFMPSFGLFSTNIKKQNHVRNSCHNFTNCYRNSIWKIAFGMVGEDLREGAVTAVHVKSGSRGFKNEILSWRMASALDNQKK